MRRIIDAVRNPAQLVLAAFVVLITVGTALLALPWAFDDGHPPGGQIGAEAQAGALHAERHEEFVVQDPTKRTLSAVEAPHDLAQNRKGADRAVAHDLSRLHL